MSERATTDTSLEELEAMHMAVLKLSEANDLGFAPPANLFKVANCAARTSFASQTLGFVRLGANRWIVGRFVTLNRFWSAHRAPDYGPATLPSPKAAQS